MDYVFICAVAALMAGMLCKIAIDARNHHNHQVDEANRMRMWAGESPEDDRYYR